MSVLHCTSSEAFAKIISKGNAVIDFSAVWCGPCKVIAPQFERLAKENPDIFFVHIDINDAREGMEKEISEIQSVPTFWFYKNGECVFKFSGCNLPLLEENIKKLKKEEEKPKEKKPKEAEKESTAAKESEEKAETTTDKGSDHVVKSTENKEEEKPKEAEKKVEVDVKGPEIKQSGESTA